MHCYYATVRLLILMFYSHTKKNFSNEWMTIVSMYKCESVEISALYYASHSIHCLIVALYIQYVPSYMDSYGCTRCKLCACMYVCIDDYRVRDDIDRVQSVYIYIYCMMGMRQDHHA